MSNMATCPYMVESIPLRNQNADDRGSWYAASGAQMISILFKWWPLVELGLVYGKVNFGHAFIREKVKQWIYQKLLLSMISKLVDAVIWPKVTQSTFSNLVSLETAWQNEAKFHMEPPLDGGTKFIQTVQVTWPIWPPCPFMVKTTTTTTKKKKQPNIKNLFLWNQKVDDFESWYAAFII